MSKQCYPVLTLTIAATATLVADRFVTAAGAVPAADVNVIGVTRSAAVSGDKVAVDVLGTAIVESGAAVTALDTLKTDNAGRAITWATSGAKVAIALQAATAAGQFIEVLLIPNAA